jgi:hypothetical protein
LSRLSRTSKLPVLTLSRNKKLSEAKVYAEQEINKQRKEFEQAYLIKSENVRL